MSSDSHTSNLNHTIVETVSKMRPQTVEHLMLLVKERCPAPEDEILNAILELQNQGTIKLDYQPLHPPKNFGSYVKGRVALWYWLTIIPAFAAAITVFVIPENLYPLNLFRIALGVVFILWLPGYSLIRALFPRDLPIRTKGKSLDTIERSALSLGMSLAIVPIVGLLLNYTPWGIRLTPIILSLLAFTIVSATVAIVREYKLQEPNKL